MKKIIITIALVFISVVASAITIKQARMNLGLQLNQTVNVLKKQFLGIKNSLEQAQLDIKDLNQKVDILIKNSKVKESNYTVLVHGKSKMDICNYKQELIWKDNQWNCSQPEYRSDCKPGPTDYYYKDSQGDGWCSSVKPGQKAKTYWTYRGHALVCGTDKRKAKVYSCYFVNKLGKSVEVAASNCSGKPKPSAPEYICYADWQTGSWGSCSASCGSGTRSRSVTCPKNHICRGSQPSGSQSCYAGSCSSSSSSSSSSGGGHSSGSSSGSLGSADGSGHGPSYSSPN